MIEKEKIYYSRTYRRIQFNRKGSIFFGGMLVLPVLVCCLFRLETIVNVVVRFSYWVLSQVIPKECIQIRTAVYSQFWNITYIELPTTYPRSGAVYINLLLCLMIFLIMKCFKRTGRPMAVFLLYCMCVHVVNCLYFCMEKNSFPYTVGEYSELYLKQQIGIWMMFMILAGLILGCMCKSFWGYSVLAFAGICIYSVVFGVSRYIFFLFLLYRFSILYMAVMFFVVGPMIDFLYFVMIYAAFMNKMTGEYEKGTKKGEWEWS